MWSSIRNQDEMTAQVSDKISYKNKSYSISGVRGTGLYTPKPFKREVICSACWRGYHLGYEVRENRLILFSMSMILSKEQIEVAQNGQNPLFPGIIPTMSHYDRNSCSFEGLGEEIAFTGGLLLARGFIRELYVHMGFNPAWKYEEVHELLFENGFLIQEYDRSQAMADLRSKLILDLAKPGPGCSKEQIAEWIESCFSLEY